MGQSSSHNSKDFDLKLTKEWVKQGRDFTSILESSEKYGKLSVYWKLSGDGITKKTLKTENLKAPTPSKTRAHLNTLLNLLETMIDPRIRH